MARGAKHLCRLLALILCLVTLPAPTVQAQQLGLPQYAILTISTDRMFAGSAFGQRVSREIEAQSAVLAAENRRIEADLRQEEQELTKQRPEMDAQAFRVLADAFDQKVQINRTAQDAKARELNLIGDTARAEFLSAARPILEGLMREAGAGVILERATVFLSANATDITELAIARINVAIGDGTVVPETSPVPDSP